MEISLSDGSTWSLLAINDLFVRRCGGGFSKLQLLSNGQSTVLSGTQNSTGLQVVVKLTISPGTAKSEAYFLAAWQANGVQVPRVILIDTAIHQFEPDILVMERVSGVPLVNTGPVSSNEVKRIAQIQSLMHLASGKGYGRPDGQTPWQGVVDTFSHEMEIEWKKRLLQLAKQEMFQGNLRTKFVAATACVEADCNGAEHGGALTHSDLSTGNILRNDHGALVIIDPNCRITHPAMCATYTFLRLSLGSQPDIARIYRTFYLSYSGISEQVFDAALQLRAMLTISTWVKKGNISDAASAARIAGLS